jgi:hypothetical protein
MYNLYLCYPVVKPKNIRIALITSPPTFLKIGLLYSTTHLNVTHRTHTSVPSSPSSSNKGPVTDSVFFFFGFGGGFGGTLTSLLCPLGSELPGGEPTKEFLLLAVPGSSSYRFRFVPSGTLLPAQLSLGRPGVDLLDAATCGAGLALGVTLMLGVLLLILPRVPGFALVNTGICSS